MTATKDEGKKRSGLVGMEEKKTWKINVQTRLSKHKVRQLNLFLSHNFAVFGKKNQRKKVA